MNKKRLLQLVLIVCMLFCAFGCNGEKTPEPAPAPDQDLTPAEQAEVAMGNFVKKLEAGNYMITGGQRAVINAVSPDLVMFQYHHDYDPFRFVFMSLKGETFETELYDSDKAVEEVTFISTDNAIKVNSEMLPNGWIDYTEGNMFEVFYNNVDNPLEFTTNDEIIKTSLLTMGGYSQFALRCMEEVHILLDKADPDSAHITAVVNDDMVTRIEYDDLDLTIEFGAGKSDDRVDAWLKNPVYPEVRTGWTRDDIDTMELTFFRDYGEKAVPFPKKVSHAMIFDPKAYDQYTGIRLIDPNYTEKDVEDYKAQLVSEGFVEGKGTAFNGEEVTVYRKLLREAYGAYSQLYPRFENGLLVEGRMYYEIPEYEGQTAINEAIQKWGFNAMPSTDLFEGWIARDIFGAQSESWAYFFDYNFYSGFYLTYKDFENAKAYLSSYADSMLNKGFIEGYTPGEDNRMVTSPNKSVSFRYEFVIDSDDTVYVEFKNEKCLTVEEVQALLQKHGLPETDIKGDIQAKNVARYYYEIGTFQGLRLLCFQPYESTEAAEAYLDKYVPGLEELGYYMVNPQKIGSQRQYTYLNEEIAKYVGFDILPGNGNAQILWEIVSWDQLESRMDAILGVKR